MDKHYEMALMCKRFPAKSSSQNQIYWYDASLYSSSVHDHPVAEPCNIVEWFNV